MLLVGTDTSTTPTMQETQPVSARESTGKNVAATDFSIAAIMAKGSAKDGKASNEGKWSFFHLIWGDLTRGGGGGMWNCKVEGSRI